MNRVSIFFKFIWCFLSDGEFRKGLSFLSKAILQSSKDDWEGAIVNYKSVLSISSMDWRKVFVLKNLGVAYFQSQNYEEAERTLQEALRINIKKKFRYPELYAYLGRLSYRRGDLEEALMFYERAAEAGQKGVGKMIAERENIFKDKEIMEKYMDRIPFIRAHINQQRDRDDRLSKLRIIKDDNND